MAAQPEGRQEKYVPAPPRKLFSPTQACRKLTVPTLKLCNLNPQFFAKNRRRPLKR